MKKRKLFGLILLLVLLSGLFLGWIFSNDYVKSAVFHKVTIEIEDIDKQGLTSQNR